jgi:anti-anti-sigma factor
MLQIHERDVGDVVILDFAGKIFEGGEEMLVKERVDKLVKQGRKNIVFNLAAVTHIDSIGLGMMVSSKQTIERAGGRVDLIGLTHRITRLLATTRLLRYFAYSDSQEKALARHSDARAGRVAERPRSQY